MKVGKKCQNIYGAPWMTGEWLFVSNVQRMGEQEAITL